MTDHLFLHVRFLPDPEAPADALLVRGGRILALGPSDELRRDHPHANTVDLRGRTLLPGLVDTHCHLVTYGLSRLVEADLRGCRSVAELQERLRAHQARAGIRAGDGRWLIGRGFDQELFEPRGWPTRQDLDAVSGEIPVVAHRICTHGLVASTAALRAAFPGEDLTRDLLSPGEAPDSFARGILTEDRRLPLMRAIPEPDEKTHLEAARLASHEAAAVGFTGIHCLAADEKEVRAVQQLAEQGDLPVRIRLQLPHAMADSLRAVGISTGFGSGRLHVGALKIFSDGAFGSHTAAMREPYADDPGNTGTLMFPQAELDAVVQKVADAGCQVCVHAIGDAALDAVLTAFERCRGLRPRPRVEHAALCPPDLLERMRRLGAVAAVQPQFVVSDWWIGERLGQERLRWLYPFKTMLEAGLIVAGGTDCPIERLAALEAVGAAVHRAGVNAQEALSVEEAVALFTTQAARVTGEEELAGRLAPGYRADFIALEQDPRAVKPEEIEKIPVALTVVDGEIVHRADS